MSAEKICFIISPIGDLDSDTRKLSDEKFDLVLKPVLEKLGYTPIRADKENSSNSISRGIVKRLFDSKLVIADATGFNANVFYELAIRNTVKKPVIIIKEIDQKLPFDVADKRAISINMKDNRQWTKAKEDLEQHIINAEKDPKSASESIVSEYTFELDVNKTADKEQELALTVKDLKDELRTMRGDLKLQNKNTTALTADILKKANFTIDFNSLKDNIIGIRWEGRIFNTNDLMKFEISDSKGNILISREESISPSRIGTGHGISHVPTEDGVYIVRAYVNNVMVFSDRVQMK